MTTNPCKLTGVELISVERKRQVEAEGYDPSWDDTYVGDELALAACSYAIPETWRRFRSRYDGKVPTTWPWAAEFWKPTPDDRIRELVKAGALIAAEIDRLQRAGHQ